MGMLINGEWRCEEIFPTDEGGHFMRRDATFHNWITADGSPGISGNGGFKAEPARYHLYVSLACPWAHRTLIFRKLKKLEKIISVSVVDPFMGDRGWAFVAPHGSTTPGSTLDHLNAAQYLCEIYLIADPHYTGRVTVPVLWDKRHRTIVNNESSEIIRMLNREFDNLTDVHDDFYPAHLQHPIDDLNSMIYANVNNGVYRCGFARSQKAYEDAFDSLFAALDNLEARLSKHRYLCGNSTTEADWRLFTTLVRFDAVYYGHFKCNLRRLIDSPNLWNYTRDLYQTPGVAETVNLAQIKRHYYASHSSINPNRIVPKGPVVDFTDPHDRNRPF